MYNYRYYYRLPIAYYNYVIDELCFSKALEVLHAFDDSKRRPEGRNTIPTYINWKMYFRDSRRLSGCLQHIIGRNRNKS